MTYSNFLANQNERHANSDQSVFWFLVRAHDSNVRNKQWSLTDRTAAASILWCLVIKTPIGARMNP